jgi:hypothetical protein
VSESARKSPDWLRPLWSAKKRETADRVREAVSRLQHSATPVTLAAICATVRAVFGVNMSANTITRNELAYEIYVGHRGSPRRPTGQDSALRSVLADACGIERRALQSKVSRLRRMTKDALIARVLQLERSAADHQRVENALRDEIVRIQLETIANARARAQS